MTLLARVAGWLLIARDKIPKKMLRANAMSMLDGFIRFNDSTRRVTPLNLLLPLGVSSTRVIAAVLLGWSESRTGDGLG